MPFHATYAAVKKASVAQKGIGKKVSLYAGLPGTSRPIKMHNDILLFRSRSILFPLLNLPYHQLTEAAPGTRAMVGVNLGSEKWEMD